MTANEARELTYEALNSRSSKYYIEICHRITTAAKEGFYEIYINKYPLKDNILNLFIEDGFKVEDYHFNNIVEVKISWNKIVS